MLAGHYAPALVLKRHTARVPLWALFVAVQAVDFLFFFLVFAGAEEAALHPGELPKFSVALGIWSHSLGMTLIYCAVVAGVGALAGYRREGGILALAVGAHWVLDLLVHVPDLPLWMDQGSAVGLGLWRLPVVPWLLECALLVAAGAYLVRGAVPVRRKRIWSLVAGLCVLQTLSEYVIPLPPTQAQLGISALAVYVGASAAAWWAGLAITRAEPPGAA